MKIASYVFWEEQNGFRKDWGGEDNMFLMNEFHVHNRKVVRHMHLAFLDNEKKHMVG